LDATRLLPSQPMSGARARMRLTVIGTGYLGLTHAVCMAELGHEVLALDVDHAKVTNAARGGLPFFEPSLEQLLRKNLETGRLHFATSYAEVAEFGDVHFLCVFAWNREFPRGVLAVQNSSRPDRDVFGVTSTRADGLLRQQWENQRNGFRSSFRPAMRPVTCHMS
jgi:UDP-glucose 6-dehydrogenase